MHAALAAGQLVRGVLHVSRFNSQHAFLRKGHRTDQGEAKDILILGPTARNRAMQVQP